MNDISMFNSCCSIVWSINFTRNCYWNVSVLQYKHTWPFKNSILILQRMKLC